MSQAMNIKAALNGFSKAAEGCCQSKFDEHIDHDKKIRSIFSHEK